VAEIPNVRLNLSNRAENVLLVRQALSGLSETIELDPVELNDVSTAVSEACNNVVMHAYGGEEGPLDVEIYALGQELEVIVRDYGRGIQPRAEHPEQIVGGIGLPVIRALSRSVDFIDLDGGGTEVRMHFSTTGASALERPSRATAIAAQAADSREVRDGRTSLTVGPARLARTVVPRVLSALAARAYFSTDRISDTQMLADALVAHSEGSIEGERMTVEITAAPREMRLRIGPLREGHAERLLEEASLDGLGSLLERLADGHEVHHEGSAEVLDLHLAERG
jgi:anti-sigma regulatory factor (Ser/Thr protein kinase)